MEIRNDRLKGMSYTELGRKYHIDPRTAKRYAESPQRPEYTLSVPKPTKLDAYKQQVDQWLEEAPYSAVRILEKLKEQGFEGKYSIVKEYVRSRKMDLDEKATVRFETMPGKQTEQPTGRQTAGPQVIVNHLHRYIREQLRQGTDPEAMIANFYKEYPDCILICDEIGNGIVPMEAEERTYRECTGRILEGLAAQADEVVRVVCGIGQKIK